VALTKREKRMLRWTMRFTANNGPEYVAQLAGLGAILAIPLGTGAEPRFELVRDLRKRPAVAKEEDVSEVKRIYWIDDKPNSVRDVLTTLGLARKPLPGRFVAFMPEALEKQLFEMEKREMERQAGSYDEDRIDETVFRVVHGSGGRYEPQLVSLRLKP